MQKGLVISEYLNQLCAIKSEINFQLIIATNDKMPQDNCLDIFKSIFKSFLKTDAEKAFVTLFNDHAGDWNKIADSLSEHTFLGLKWEAGTFFHKFYG